MKTFFSVFLPLIALDAVWLTAMGKRFYGKHLSHLMGGTLQWPPVVFFYALYAVGICFFVVLPSLKNNLPIGQVFLTGAFLGLLAYGAYDFTNQATLRNWPVIVTIVDLAWGMVLAGLVSVVAVSVLRHL